MNYFECQEIFKNMYPGKDVGIEFDDNCIRTLEIIYSDGIPNPIHHIEYQKVKVTFPEQNPVYIPIAPHRMVCEWKYAKDHINKSQDPK